MSIDIKVRRGVDIKLVGEADKVYGELSPSETYVVKPSDFHGVVPKLLVAEGDEVLAGTPLFYSKDNDRIRFTSPVSGEVAEIKRGEKRKILEIKILADKEIRYETFNPVDSSELNKEKVTEALLGAGLWPMLRQRPYDVIANPEEAPKAIFISGFDSAPLAPDYDFILEGAEADFQAGIDALSHLTAGKVRLGLRADSAPAKTFTEAKGIDTHTVSGPHPAGNVGIQIHHLDPINKGEVVWYINPQDVAIVGRFFNSGKYDASKTICVAGSEVNQPRYYKVISGMGLSGLLSETLKGDHLRIISGNVLTGTRIEKDGYLGYYDHMVTAIPEGDEQELFGWIAPGFNKFSTSRAFWSWLTPNKKYVLDSNMHGEKRAYVVTGQYESVLPMDIYPQQLIKAIMVGDIEAMENLGIYEVSAEDFALCEVVCTSKMDVQKTIQEGLDMIKHEMS